MSNEAEAGNISRGVNFEAALADDLDGAPIQFCHRGYGAIDPLFLGLSSLDRR